jgi:pilus assembly protein CpaB
MNGRSGLMMAVAIVLGLGAMFGANRLLGRGQRPGKMREILAAARDLKVEEVLKPDMVKVVKVPEASVPAGSFASYEDAADRWVRMPLLAGEPILDGKLAPKGAPLGLLARIPDGMRAFAIEVNEQSGVSGFVLPDHRVDVLVARTGRATAEGREDDSETILQNVIVLAAGQETTRPEDKSIQVRTVTLAVTPEQVETLVGAKTRGTLSLSLRGHNDAKILEIPKPEPRTTAIEEPPEAEPPPPEPPPPVVAAEAPNPVPARRRTIWIFRGPPTHSNRNGERIEVGGSLAPAVVVTAGPAPSDDGPPASESRPAGAGRTPDS